MGKNRTVVIDPARSFGAPICSPSGMRTSLLYKGYKAESDDWDSIATDFAVSPCRAVQAVSWWYNTKDVEVNDAIAYEERLAA